MSLKPLISLLLFFLACQSANSQSVYDIHYNFNAVNDSISYHSFFLLYNNGSGFARIKYNDPATSKITNMELEIIEEPGIDNTGNEDTSTLFIRTTGSKIIAGDSTTKFSPPVFIFKINPVTGYFEPMGVSKADANPEITPGTLFRAKLVEKPATNRPFISEFFGKEEEFSVNLLKPKTRGGFTLAPDERKIKLHLLIVADIDDTTIGPSCDLDMKKALTTFDSIRKHIGLQFNPKAIYGKTYSKKNVQSAIANLKPSPDDIVVFYYTGHGFRKLEEQRRFPNIKLKTFHKNRKDVLDNSMNMEDIFNSIRKKGARLNLVFSDCCNDDIETVNAEGKKPGEKRGSTIDWNDTNIRDLFLNKTRLSILATAAQNGQRASSNRSFGGFFTYFFKIAIENFSSKLKYKVSWEQILTDTRKQTTFKANHTYCSKPFIPENICKQIPDFIIETEAKK